MSIGSLLSSLHCVKSVGQSKWMARCPAHEDGHASLSILNDAGKVLIKCHAGCTAEEVVKAAGLTMGDLFVPKPDAQSQAASKPASRQEVAAYDYRDSGGVMLYQVVRFAPKDFRQRRPDGEGGWTWNLNGTARVLYRLPELLTADKAAWVFVAEGEKDADALFQGTGVAATCNAGGAGKWRTLSDDDALCGRRVCIVADKDNPGRKHARDVAERLTGKAAEVKVIELPGAAVKDAADWIESLDSRAPDELRTALLDMAENAPDWTLDGPIGDPLESLDAELKAERAGLRKPIPVPWAAQLVGASRLTAPGTLAVLAGTPGSAKSFLALNLLMAAKDAGHRASYLPLESDRAFHLRRLLAVLDGNWRALSDPLKVSDATALATDALALHRANLAQVAESILENPCKPTRNAEGELVVPDISAADVLKMIEARVETDRLIIIDPFTMIRFDGRDQWRSEDAFIRSLVGIAAESRAVLVVVAHLTKNTKGPLDLSHVQGASAFTRLASTVLMLQRCESNTIDVWAPGGLRRAVESNLTVHIGKARNAAGTGSRLAYTFGLKGPQFEEHGVVAPKRRAPDAF